MGRTLDRIPQIFSYHQLEAYALWLELWMHPLDFSYHKPEYIPYGKNFCTQASMILLPMDTNLITKERAQTD